MQQVYHDQELAMDLQKLAKGRDGNERNPPGRLSSFTESTLLMHTSADRHRSGKAAIGSNSSTSSLKHSKSQNKSSLSTLPNGTIELDSSASYSHSNRQTNSVSGLLRHPESQRLLLTGNSWGVGINGQAAKTFGFGSQTQSTPNLFSHSILAFRELRRLVLDFLSGPDSRLFSLVDGLDITDDELDELLYAGGNFTLYHLQHLNILQAQFHSFGELIKVIKFLSSKSLEHRERVFAYLNQHHVNIMGEQGHERICHLFAAKTKPFYDYSTWIPSFSWNDIDTLYIEGLAGDSTLDMIFSLEDSNPHLRLVEDTPSALITKLSQFIKEHFLKQQAQEMKKKKDTYYKSELLKVMQGFEEFLTLQPGTKAHAARQAKVSQQSGSSHSRAGSTTRPSGDENSYAYLEPLVALLSSPSTHLFSTVIPIKSNDLISLLSLCYDDVNRTLWFLKQMNDSIQKHDFSSSSSIAASSTSSVLPTKRFADFAELKYAVYQMILQDDQIKTDVFNYLNKDPRGRRLLNRESASDSDPSHPRDYVDMDEVETLYRQTWPSIHLTTQPTGGGTDSNLLIVLQSLPLHVTFDTLESLISYILTYQNQQQIQARKRALAADRNLLAGWINTNPDYIPKLLTHSTKKELTQQHLDQLLMAARSDLFDLTQHPLFTTPSNEHKTATGRYLNADSSSTLMYAGIIESFQPGSSFPALQAQISYLLRAQATFDDLPDLIQAITFAKQTMDDKLVQSMLTFLSPLSNSTTTSASQQRLPTNMQNGAGLKLFQSSPPSTYDTFNPSEFTLADMYLLILLSGSGHQSLQVLQRLLELRQLPQNEQVSVQRSPDAIRCGLDAINWPIKSVEELAVRMNSMWRFKFSQATENSHLSTKSSEESKEAPITLSSTHVQLQRRQRPPVYDNVYTALSAQAYTPEEDSDHIRHLVDAPENEEFGPTDRIQLYEFLTSHERTLVRVPNRYQEEQKSSSDSIHLTTLPPLSREMLHSLLSSGGGLTHTLAHMRTLESSSRTFNSFAQLQTAIHHQETNFQTLTETIVYIMRTYKGRVFMKDVFSKPATETSEQQPENLLAPTRHSNRDGILNSDPDMLACISSWILALLPSLDYNLFVLFYLKHLLNMPTTVGSTLKRNAPTLKPFNGLDGLSAVITELYQFDRSFIRSLEAGRERNLYELTPEEENWLEEEPEDRPSTANHQLTVSNQGAHSTLLQDHPHLNPILTGDTLGYANSSSELVGLSPLDVAEFEGAYLGDPKAKSGATGRHRTSLSTLDHSDPFFVQLVRQKEEEANEIMAYLKSGHCHLLDPRSQKPDDQSRASRTASLATPDFVASLQRAGGLGPLSITRPRNELARYLGVILRSTFRWKCEQEMKLNHGLDRKSVPGGKWKEVNELKDVEGKSDNPGQPTAPSIPAVAMMSPQLNGFNSLDMPPPSSNSDDGSSTSVPSTLLASYQLPSYFVDFPNSPTLHLLQQLELMETRFIHSTSATTAMMNDIQVTIEDGSPNTELLLQVLANRYAKAVQTHTALFTVQGAKGAERHVPLPPPSTSSNPSIIPPAARDAPPSFSCYLEDIHSMDHPDSNWLQILPKDKEANPGVEMIFSNTIPSYLIPKPVEYDYADDGEHQPPEPLKPNEHPPSFRESAINLALTLLKFDDSFPARLKVLGSLDAPAQAGGGGLGKLIARLQQLQPQLGLLNTLLAVDAKRQAPSSQSPANAAAAPMDGLSPPPPQLAEEEFELSSVADTPFPPAPHPSFLSILQPFLSGLSEHFLSLEFFYKKHLPTYLQQIHPLLSIMSQFYTSLYEALRAAQYVGSSAPQASTASHPLHPHLMLTLPLLQASFHVLTYYLDGRTTAQLHPTLYRLEAFSLNLHQFLIQLGPVTQWLNKLMVAPSTSLSPAMREFRDLGLADYKRFIINLPPFLTTLLPFVTSMQSYLSQFIPFARELNQQYRAFVRPLLLPILPLLVPLEKEKGHTYQPHPSSSTVDASVDSSNQFDLY